MAESRVLSFRNDRQHAKRATAVDVAGARGEARHAFEVEGRRLGDRFAERNDATGLEREELADGEAGVREDAAHRQSEPKERRPEILTLAHRGRAGGRREVSIRA